MQWKVFSQRIEKQPNEWSTYNFHTAAAFPHILPSHLWLFIWSHLIYIVRLQQATLYVLGLQLQIWGGSFKTFMWRAKTEKRKRGFEGRGGRSPRDILLLGRYNFVQKKRDSGERAARKIMPPTKIKTFAVIVQAHLPHLLHSQFPRELFQCLMRTNFNC